jgi:hypothetical protein
MSRLDIYKKLAKQLVRWHREGNYSIGGRIRGLARYQSLTDREALARKFPLREAQEIIALEAGYASWTALKVAVANAPTTKLASPTLRLTRAVPVIFVANLKASAEFFKDTLGFSIDFLHGKPPFYGSVSRDGACVHLKFVHDSARDKEVVQLVRVGLAALPHMHGNEIGADVRRIAVARNVVACDKVLRAFEASEAFLVAGPDFFRPDQ